MGSLMLITIDITSIVLFLIISDPVFQAYMNITAWKQLRRRNRVQKLFNKIEYVFDKYNLKNEVHAKV